MHNQVFFAFSYIGIIVAGTFAGLAIIKLFVLPNSMERKNKQ